jgi:hypothetical protein
MMMRYMRFSLIFIVVIVQAHLSFSQVELGGRSWSVAMARQDIRQGNVYLYCCWGLPVVASDSSAAVIERLEYECTEELTKQYGFKYVSTGTGCFKPDGVDAYNKIVGRYLRRRNGRLWEESLNADIQKCIVARNHK